MAKAKSKKRNHKVLVEICRSFSFHKNLGNYEGADFFASAKSQVKEKEAEKTSEKLYEFCKESVVRDINSYLKDKKSELLTIKEEILAEVKRWIQKGGDKEPSDYGKESVESKQKEVGKIEEIKSEELATNQ